MLILSHRWCLHRLHRAWQNKFSAQGKRHQLCTGSRCTSKVGTGQAGEGCKHSDGSSCMSVFASQCIQQHRQAMDRAGAPARYVCMSLCSLVGSETAPIPATTCGFHSVDGSSSTIPAQLRCKSTVTSICPRHNRHHCILLCTMSAGKTLCASISLLFPTPEYTSAICIPPQSVK